MREHLGRGVGLVLSGLLVFIGPWPAASAQQDVDAVLKAALDRWKEGTPASRAQAIEILGSLGTDAAPTVPLLTAALGDPSPPIRAQAAEILGRMGRPVRDSVPALAALLDDPEATVRERAAVTLALQGKNATASIGPLVASLRAAPDRRCPMAAFALASIGEPALPSLIDLLKAGDPAIRQAAIDGIRESAESGLWRKGRAVGRILEPRYPTLALDAEPSVRIALGRMLLVTRRESPPVLAALGVLLHDPDIDVRLAVLKAVEDFGQLPAGLRPAFLERFKDSDGRVRVAAATAVPSGSLEDAGVIDRLLGALKDPDPNVRTAAAQKLAQARSTSLVTDERGRLVYWISTSRALKRHPGAGVILASTLDDPRPGVRAAAARLLPAFPADAAAAIPRLAERLRDPDPGVRAGAAHAFAELGPRTRVAVRVLLGILANPVIGDQQDRNPAFPAARALAAIGGDARAKMLRLLIGQLNSLDDGVRTHAEQVLAALGSNVLDDLLRVLADPRSSRRVQAEAQGLLYNFLVQGWLQQVLAANPALPAARAAIPAMRSLARGDDPEAQLAALALLATIDPGDAEVAELCLDRIRARADPDLDDQWLAWVVKPPLIPELIKGLTDPEVPVRLGTAKVVWILADRLARNDAQEADSPQPEATGARSRDGRQRLKVQAARALLSALKDADDRVRWYAAEALGTLQVEPETAIPALIDMARNGIRRSPPDDVVIRSFEIEGQSYSVGQNRKGGDPLRIAAIQALGGFGGDAAEAVPEIIRSLKDQDLRVRWFAAEALGVIGPRAKTAVPALVEALRSRDVATGDDADGSIVDQPIRLIAAFALGKIGPDARAATPELIAALSDPDSRVRAEAARALGRIGPDARAAIPELIRLATRGTVAEVGEAARDALARLGPVAVPAAIEMLHHGDADIRAEALDILGRMNAKTPIPFHELVRCLSDPQSEVRVAAAAALTLLGERPAAVAAVPRLLIASWDDDERVSVAAANALAVIIKPASRALRGALTPNHAEEGGPFELVTIPLIAPRN